jgi:hypothetical protein
MCPSPRAFRGLRLAAITVAIAISATMGLALAHWGAAESSEMVSPVAEEPPPAADLRGPLADVAPTAPARGHDCKAGAGSDLDASFLNPTCGPSKSHVRHAHVASRVSTFILGRTDVARDTPAVGAATDLSEKGAPSAAPSPEQPVPPVKKPKAKPRPTAIAAQDVTQDPAISAYAPPSRNGGTYGNPYGPTFRPMPPGLGTFFDRAW